MTPRHILKLAGVFAGIAILSMGILTSSVRPALNPGQRSTPYMFTFSNPAAVYCTDLGYGYQSVQDATGGMQGICVFPDNSNCDAWEFLAGKCGQQYSYCEQQGYGIRTAQNGIGGFAQEVAICTDSEGQDIGLVDELTQLSAKVYSCGQPDKSVSGNDAISAPDMDPSIQAMASNQADSTPPAAWDWRNATYNSVTGNWMTPVKDQGGCGSCWAFSTVGISEAALNLAAKNPALDRDLSEEYLVSDCHMSDGYQTCCGGWNYDALEFIRDQGIPDEGCMPYVDGLATGCGCDYGCNIVGTNACTYHGLGQCSDRTCSNRCSDWESRIVKVNQIGYVGSDPTTIKNTLVAYGPLSVSIRASNWVWDGDVLRCTVDAPTNHAIDIVGYQDTPGVGSGGYWIIKNSWGATWDGDGYAKIGYGECSIESEVYYASVLSLADLTPTPISPSGTINGIAKPTFKWTASLGATSYRLAVYSYSTASYLILDTVASSSCDLAECSYPSPVSLSDGDYKFKVLAYTTGGVTPYSTWMTFTVTGITLPPPANPPTPIAPSGTVTTHRPTFQWSAVEYAAFYRLGVYSLATGTYLILENIYPSCMAGVCSFTHSTIDLPNGNFKFKVLARNSSGYTAYSSWMSFTVSSNLPVAPTLLAPSGTAGANPPEFQWNPVPGATGYRLAVYSYDTGSYVILTYVYPSACSGNVCAYTPPSALASGNYKFKMLTYNAYGASGYSAFMSFTVP